MDALEDLIIPLLEEPKEPDPKTATKGQIRIWEKKLDQHAIREVNFANNIQSLYSLVWGQCSDSMHAKVESNAAFALVAKPKSHGIELLKIIKKISFNFESHKYLSHTVHQAKRNFYMHKQEKHTTPTAYYESFLNLVDVLRNVKAPFLPDESILAEVAGKNTVDDVIRAEAVERYLATTFLLGADRTRYGVMIAGYENSFTDGIDKYPKTVNDAYMRLVNYKNEHPAIQSTGSDGVVFNNIGDEDETGDNMLNAGRGGRGRGGRGSSGRGR